MAAGGHEMKEFTVIGQERAEACSAQPHRAFEHRIEHWSEAETIDGDVVSPRVTISMVVASLTANASRRRRRCGVDLGSPKGRGLYPKLNLPRNSRSYMCCTQ